MRRIPPLLAAVGLTGAAAASWWEGTFRWESLAAHVSVIGTIAGVVLLAVLAGRGRQCQTTRRWLAGIGPSIAAAWRARAATSLLVAAWAVLAAAVLGWDLASLELGSSRDPTLSSLIGHLSRHVAGRAALSLAWLALGVALALGGRARWRSGETSRP